MPNIAIIIPAWNEAESIGQVLRDIPDKLVQEIIVVDNGSTDRTAEVARSQGATVLSESRKGYGFACLKGMEYLAQLPPAQQADIVVFLDADYSDHPEELPLLLAPLEAGEADLVIGSRIQAYREAGSMMPQQIFGNWLATRLIQWLYGYRFTDLGPFRAIRYSALMSLGMEDRTYGWTVEMQVKAIRHELRCREVPVHYRKRIGVSKVSGTLKGTILAGYKIIWTVLKYGY